MRKKRCQEALHGAVMSLHKTAKAKVKVGTHLYEVFEVIVGAQDQGSALPPLLFVIVIDVDTNEIKQGTLQ